ncbi:hypothetical protein IGL76_000689 [Enterococcus sp. DIV2381]|uniref:Dihydrolipoamide dehydrogenase n=1 Tax=Candidatus Enterococcus mangumiae TaxID=2230878 RepID=A0ABZ2SXL0_9ENTE
MIVLKNASGKWQEVTLDGKTERIREFRLLKRRRENEHYLAVIFENESYLIVDRQGQSIEVITAVDGYSKSIATSITWQETSIDAATSDDEMIDTFLTKWAQQQSTTHLVDCWVGLPEQRFLTYKKWRTPSGYLCGTYAAAVLLAYYQDYCVSDLIPSDIRQKDSRDAKELIQKLRHTIQPLGFPTIPIQVSSGISAFFKTQQEPIYARSTVVGSWQRATKRIRQGKPVMIGILKLLGSTYGNHWVTAYAYYESASGERYYKVHDNWGNTNKVIPAKWANGTVSLP